MSTEIVENLLGKCPTHWPRVAGGGRARTPDEIYNRWWVARVQAKCLIDSDGCWIWQGFVFPKTDPVRGGYGGTTYRSRNIKVHRGMYIASRAVQLTSDQFVCHTCDKRLCVNPNHLWLGNAKQNSLDMISKGRCHEQKVTHCPKGHEYNEENTGWKTAASGRRARVCKECVRVRCREAYRAKRRLLLGAKS